MATKKISELPLADALTGSEVIPVVQDGITKKIDSSYLVGPEGPAGGPTIGFATKALMDLAVSYPDGTLAVVTDDPTEANNGTWRWDAQSTTWSSFGDPFVRTATLAEPEGASLVGFSGVTGDTTVEDALTQLDNSFVRTINPVLDSLSPIPAEYREAWLSKFPAIPIPLISESGKNISWGPDDVSVYADWETDSSLVVHYVDGVNGLDANDGLTWATAKKSLWRPVFEGTADVILVRAGVYDRPANTLLFTDAAGVPKITRDMRFVAVGGKVISAVQDPLTWVNTTGTAYQATGTTLTTVASTHFLHCTDVVDAEGLPLRLVKVATQAEVEATVGTFSLISGALTVNIGKEPSAYSIVNPRATTVIGIEDSNVYFENFEFRGYEYFRVKPAVAGTPTRAVFNRCGWVGMYGNAFESRNAETFLFDCYGFNSRDDIFNYHSFDSATSTNPGFAYEEGCVAGWAGESSAADSDNCSTAHTGCIILRLNCNYKRSYGPVVADVNLGTASLNVKVTAGDALNGADAASTVPFIATNNSKMWLDGCTAFGNTYYATRGGSSGSLAYRNLTVDREAISFGTLTTY